MLHIITFKNVEYVHVQAEKSHVTDVAAFTAAFCVFSGCMSVFEIKTTSVTNFLERMPGKGGFAKGTASQIE